MTENILIAYYSRTGNTERIASLIQQQVGGDLIRIIPETAYAASYNETLNRAEQEIKAGVHPPLKPTPMDPADFATIFIGTPNWWSTIAPPVATFLTSYNLAGKTVAPFCTHGGGGLDNIARDLKALCPGAAVTAAFVTYGSGGSRAEAEISTWLADIGLRAY
jgi:flavodoxin